MTAKIMENTGGHIIYSQEASGLKGVRVRDGFVTHLMFQDPSSLPNPHERLEDYRASLRQEMSPERLKECFVAKSEDGHDLLAGKPLAEKIPIVDFLRVGGLTHPENKPHAPVHPQTERLPEDVVVKLGEYRIQRERDRFEKGKGGWNDHLGNDSSPGSGRYRA